MDSDDDQDIQLILFDFDSQVSDIKDVDFWSEVVEDIDVLEFVEFLGLIYQLFFDVNFLQFFMVIFFFVLVQIIVDNINLYVVQSVDQGWVDIIIDEMKVFFGLQILMGIIQLFRYIMYWLLNKFMGKLYQYYECCFYLVFFVYCFY